MSTVGYSSGGNSGQYSVRIEKDLLGKKVTFFTELVTAYTGWTKSKYTVHYILYTVYLLLAHLVDNDLPAALWLWGRLSL